MTPDNENDPLPFLRIKALVQNVLEQLKRRERQQKERNRDTGSGNADEGNGRRDRQNVDYRLNKRPGARSIAAAGS